MNETTSRGRRTARCFLTALLLAPLAVLHAGETSKVTLVAEPARVQLTTERQKLVFTRTDDVFVLSTFGGGGKWTERGTGSLIDRGRSRC
jgi:hypothetical protein